MIRSKIFCTSVMIGTIMLYLHNIIVSAFSPLLHVYNN